MKTIVSKNIGRSNQPKNIKDMTKVTKDKFVGCMQGGAVGDALGAPIEFLSMEEIRAQYGKDGIQDYVEYDGPKGAFTDDTQMALFTAEALLRGEHNKVVRDIEVTLYAMAHQAYLRWLHTQGITVKDHTKNEGAYDIKKGWLIKHKVLHQNRGASNTVVSALSSGNAGTMDNPINESKGCGTVMRIAPVGLMYYGKSEKAFPVACDFSAITHGHPTGYLSAGFLAALIADLSVEIPFREAIAHAKEILKEWKNHEETMQAVERALEMAKTIQSKLAEPTPETMEQLGKGWVAEEALAMALLASLVYENDFKKGVLFAVNHGGDSDSTGAITGNILGLLNGLEQIPDKWIEQLVAQDIVKQMGEDLHQRLNGYTNNANARWMEKYGD